MSRREALAAQAEDRRKAAEAVAAHRFGWAGGDCSFPRAAPEPPPAEPAEEIQAEPPTDAAPPGLVPARVVGDAAPVPWQAWAQIGCGLVLVAATAVFLFLGRLARPD